MQPLLRFLHGHAPRPNAARGLRITLARRLVETQGAPFVESHEVFHDLASARDELGLLPAAQGPTVVRVDVEGGTDEDWEALAGDWLVDPDLGGRVVHLPVPQWTYNNKARAWVRARPWLEAWETCQDASWMLHAACASGVERKLLVLAACACARMALPFVPAGEERPLRAIETAERWTRGEATLDEVRYAADAADAAADDDAPDAAAARFAADAADAAYAATPDDAAWFADDAASIADTRARFADLVRRMIPTLAVLRVVATRTRHR